MDGPPPKVRWVDADEAAGRRNGRFGAVGGSVPEAVSMPRNLKLLVVGFLPACIVPLVMAQSCTPAGDGGTGTLEGTWTGQVAVTVKYAHATTGEPSLEGPGVQTFSTTIPVSISFDAAGAPSLMPIMTIGSPQTTVGHATAVVGGATATAVFGATTLTVTVKEASYSPTHVKVVLQADLNGNESQGGLTATLRGSSEQTLEFTLASGGLSWLGRTTATRSRRTGEPN